MLIKDNIGKATLLYNINLQKYAETIPLPQNHVFYAEQIRDN